jgi:DNA-binding MarR family transcriptional regulator
MTFLDVFGIILASGCAGGLANYVLSLDDVRNGEPSDNPFFHWLVNRHLFKSVILGMAASLIVPLFLEVGQSDLFNDILNPKASDPKLGDAQVLALQAKSIFILIGFCVIASISSKRFIETMSSRVLQKAEDASELAETAASHIRELEERSEEVDIDSLPEDDAAPLAAQQDSFSGEALSVLKALDNKPTVRRAITVLAKEASLDKITVKSALQELIDKQFAEEIPSLKHSGQKRYRITNTGRMLASGHL